MLGNADDVDEIEKCKLGLNLHIANLIEAINTKDK